MVIDNAFDLVGYVIYVVTVIVVAIFWLPTLLKKAKEGFRKYGFKRFPINFMDRYTASNILELMFVICFILFYVCWLIYGFFDHRLDEIIRYIGADVLLK